MNIWTSILLIWVGVNVLLVGLVWRYEWMKERRTRSRRNEGHTATAGDPDTHDAPREPTVIPRADSARRRRIVLMTPSTPAAHASPRAGPPPHPASLPCGGPPHRLCRLHEMHEEIRVLKLTVAELALDKAMLSAAAAAHKRALP